MAERLCLGCMEKIKDKYEICPYCGYADGTPAKEAYHIAPGNVLAGKYIVGQVIGFGGFGVTYIGYDGLLEKKIAIKEYLPSEFATRMPGQTEVTVYSGERTEQFYSGIDKFVEEARRLAQFKDVSGIVRIYDSFMENKTAYIIMEYLEGETLKSRLEREGSLDPDEALNIMMPILEALQEVHKIGIIHRDIAPDNIFLTQKGEVKLLDFGAARYATTTHSKSLSVIIKQGYAPEEQYRSKGDQGPWTDVYACGATLYKMLTGMTPEDSMERAGKDTLLPPSRRGAKVSKNLDIAIMNAMNIRIEDRTQSAEEFKEELSSEEVRRKKAHARKMDIGRWPLGLKVGAGIAASILITLGVLLATNVIHFDMKAIVDSGLLAGNEVYVPNVVNYAVNEAETELQSHGLTIQIVDKQNSDEIPKDKILSQNLSVGSVVSGGTALEVVVSAGGEIIYMPNLEGSAQEEAKNTLNEMSIYSQITEAESEIAPGYVISQDKEEGIEIEKGSTVNLKVSSGRADYNSAETTTVPELTGKNWTLAKAAIRNASLYIYKSGTEQSATVPKGQVISQDIVVGTETAQGTSIGVIVSTGIDSVRVPDVQYKSLEEAQSLLEQAGLATEVKYEKSDTVAKDHVIRQSVEAGSEVQPQTTITIYVSTGNPNVKTPSTAVADNRTESTDGGSTRHSGRETTEASTRKPEKRTEEPSTRKPGTTTTEEPSTRKPGTTTTEAPPQPDDPDKGKIKVPTVVGLSQAEARSALEKVGLKLGTVTKRSRDNTADGTVLWQGVSAGTKVAKGSEVSIIACDNSTYTEYQPIITTTETTTSASPSLAGWTQIGYHYSDWSTPTASATRVVGQTYDGNVMTSEVWADPLYTGPYANSEPPDGTELYQGCHINNPQKKAYVQWLQHALNYTEGAGLEEDGQFGEKTKIAVQNFQKKYGLQKQEGNCYLETLPVVKAKFKEKAESQRNYWYHYRTQIYDFSKTTTTYGEWTRTKPDGAYNTRQVKIYDAY